MLGKVQPIVEKFRPIVCDYAKDYVDNLPGENFNTSKKVGQVALLSFMLFAWTCSSYGSFYVAGARAASYLTAQTVQFALIPVFAHLTDNQEKIEPMIQSFKDITSYTAALVTVYALTGAIPGLFGVAVLCSIIHNFTFARRGTPNEHLKLVGPMISLFK